MTATGTPRTRGNRRPDHRSRQGEGRRGPRGPRDRTTREGGEPRAERESRDPREPRAEREPREPRGEPRERRASAEARLRRTHRERVPHRAPAGESRDTMRTARFTRTLRVFHLRNITGYGAIYGAEQCILSWIDEMREQGGIDFLAGCFVGGGTGESEFLRALGERGVPVETIRMHHLQSPFVVRRLASLMKERGVDVVHVHENRSHILGTLAAHRAGIPAVATLHGYTRESWKSGVWARVNAWFLRRGGVDRLITPSHALRRTLVRELGFPRETVTVPNGIAIPKGGREEGNGALRAELGLDPRARLVGVVGRLSHEKGQRVFLEAIPAIAGAHARAEFLVAGDGPDRASLEARARALGIEGRVHFLGWRRDSSALVKALDVLVIPSLTEGLPVVLLEAMARAVPVVASRVGGIPEAVAHGETGILVPPEDPRCLAGAVSALLASPEKAREMGEHGVRRVRESFSITRTAEALRRIYEDVVERGAARRAS